MKKVKRALIVIQVILVSIASDTGFTYEGHVVSSPNSWYNFWYSSPYLKRILNFEYNEPLGPDSWLLKYPTCAGFQQSPINVDTTNLYSLLGNPTIQWSGYQKTAHNMTMKNTGFSIEISGNWGYGNEPLVYIFYDDASYVFSQLHFHWGEWDDYGTEHSFIDNRFAMEMHAVHYNNEYDSFAEAVEKPNGVLVLAVFFEATKFDNLEMDKILKMLPAVKGVTGLTTEIEPMSLNQIFHTYNNGYVRYHGSLTTPPCTENVVWLLSVFPMYISKSQMQEWRENVDIKQNIRPTQPLNGRHVYYG